MILYFAQNMGPLWWIVMFAIEHLDSIIKWNNMIFGNNSHPMISQYVLRIRGGGVLHQMFGSRVQHAPKN